MFPVACRAAVHSGFIAALVIFSIVNRTRHRTRSYRRARALILAAALATVVIFLLQLVPQPGAADKAGAAVGSRNTAGSGAGASAGPAPGRNKSIAGSGAKASSTAAPVAPGETPDASINAVIQANSEYQVGVALLDLNTGALKQYGVEAPFEAASTAKVLTAVAYYEMVEAGQASLDDPMGDFTSGFQLREMIQDSDNDSWTLLASAVGNATLEADAAAIGVTYDSAGNTLTTAAMAQILGNLYGGKLLTPEHTQQLLSYMQNTNNEDLIPAALPAGVTVYHKYGLLDGELHDAAILATPTHSVVLVIYTKSADLTDVPQRTAMIHDITSAAAKVLD